MRNNNLIVVLLVAVVVILGIMLYQQSNRPDTPGEKLDAAVSSVGDAVEDIGEDVQGAAR